MCSNLHHIKKTEIKSNQLQYINDYHSELSVNYFIAKQKKSESHDNIARIEVNAVATKQLGYKFAVHCKHDVVGRTETSIGPSKWQPKAASVWAEPTTLGLARCDGRMACVCKPKSVVLRSSAWAKPGRNRPDLGEDRESAWLPVMWQSVRHA